MFKKFFIAGVLVWLPIIATIWIIKILVDLFDQLITLLPVAYQPDTLLKVHIPGLGIILALIVVLLTGILVTNFLGTKIIVWMDRFFQHVPFVGPLYSTIKQVTQTIVSSEGKSFRKVLLVEYPQQGVWSIAFLTGQANERINELTGEKMLTAFVPTTPNPTGGFLIIVPEANTKELNMSVEEAFKLVVSLGTLRTEDLPKIKS